MIRKDEKGLAFIPLLVILSVGSLLIPPFLDRLDTRLISLARGQIGLVNYYSAESGVEHTLWRLRYEPGFADSLTETNPTTQYSVTTNGSNVLLTVTRKGTTASGLGQIATNVDYIVQAGHRIEYKITVDQSSDDDTWIAYDTTNMPSQVTLPSQTGDLIHYLHNNPTPPTADTVSQHPLPADTSAPSAGTLYNYDSDRDAFPGRLIQKGTSPSQGANESNPVKYQEWRSASLASDFHINGNVELALWVAMKDFNTDKTGIINIYLRDYDGSSYTEIASATVTLTPEYFQSGEFISFGPIDRYDIEASTPNITIRATAWVISTQITVLSWQIE